MGSSSNKRRRTSPPWKRLPALGLLLSWARVADAVALSDFTGKITMLTPSCRIAYETQISGCTTNDFTNTQHICSNSCLGGLVDINALVNQNCVADDVPETSILGLFKLGQAIQLLCNVEVVTTTTGLPQGGGGATATQTPPAYTMTRYSTTMTMSTSQSAIASPSTDSVQSQTRTLSTQSQSPSGGMIGNTPIAPSRPPSSSNLPPPSLATPPTSSTSSSTSSTTSLSPAAEESLRSGNIGSGGGSPFDNIDNSDATSVHALIGFFGTIAAAFSTSAFLSLG